jgi:hypothetical protein
MTIAAITVIVSRDGKGRIVVDHSMCLWRVKGGIVRAASAAGIGTAIKESAVGERQENDGKHDRAEPHYLTDFLSASAPLKPACHRLCSGPAG